MKDISLRDYLASQAPKLTLWGYICGKFHEWDQRKVSRSWIEIDADNRYEWADTMLRNSKNA